MSGTRVLWPPLLLGCGAILIHLVSRFLRRENRLLATLAAMAYAAALVALVRPASLGIPVSLNSVMSVPLLQAEPGGILIAATGLMLGMAVAVYSGTYLERDNRYESYYLLLLLMSAGMLGALLAEDLFVIYLFTVLSSASAYALVAFRRHTDTAVEAGIKYAVMGSLGSALVLFGIGFVYRDTGALSLGQIADAAGALAPVGPAFIVAGYAVKAALVPAHTWLPDAHGRAPSSVSAMLSGVYIETNAYIMLRLGLILGWSLRGLGLLLVVMAILNMLVGNIMALRQSYGKRLLAYSSIAQVGYIMLPLGLGLAYQRPEVISAGLYILVAHAAMKGLAFLCKGVSHFYLGATMVEELDAFAHRLPLIGGSFVIALAGLAGVPPAAGFMGKWQSIVTALPIGGPIVALGIGLLVLNSLLGVGYYVPLIGRLLRRPRGSHPHLAVSMWMQVPIGALALAVLALGLWPGPLLGLTRQTAEFLLSWGVR